MYARARVYPCPSVCACVCMCVCVCVCVRVCSLCYAFKGFGRRNRNHTQLFYCLVVCECMHDVYVLVCALVNVESAWFGCQIYET